MLRYFGLISISMLLATSPLLGSELSNYIEESDTTYNLGEVSVQGNKVRKEIIPVQVLSGDILKKLSVLSVADAVRYFSGVQIKDYGGVGGLKTVNVRSMGSQHVGVFYDGVKIENAQNGVVDLGRFSLDNMEEVSIYNGQKSSIFQSAKDFASASAIYMKTRTPSFEKNRRYNLNLGIKGGSFGTVNPTILWEQKLSDKISMSNSAEYMYTTGEYKFTYKKEDGYSYTDTRYNGDVTIFRVESALFGKFNGGSWDAKLYFYDSERGYPGAVVREEPGKFKNEDRQWDDNFFAQSSLQKQFSELYSIKAKAKYGYDYLHYVSDPREDVSTMYVDNTYKQQSGYFSLSHLFSVKDWWAISYSNDFEINTLDANLVNFVYPVRYSVLTSAATSFNFNKFKLQGSLLHTFVTEKLKSNLRPAENRSIFTPSVVASYKPFFDHNLNIRAFYKRVFRMPTLNDLYYTFIGNVDLKPEFTSQYNLGVTYSKYFDSSWFERFEIQVDGYYNQVEDKIIAMPTSNQFRWTMINLGYVEIKGVDLLFDATYKAKAVTLTSRLSYTYQKAQDFTDESSPWYGGQIPYTPWHSGSAIIGANYKKWSLNYSFIYTGERYEAVANIAENYALPWYTHDMSLSKTFDFKRFSMVTTAEVNNIFNQQYEVVQCYPMPGTNFKLKLNFIL